PGRDGDAVADVAQGVQARGIGADVVAFHHVAGGSGVGDGHAVPPISGDEVAGVGRVAANRVVVGTAPDDDAAQGVPERGRAVDVGADVVALYQRAGRGPEAD